jgi:murein DD-endopeptidase MepM/ murein hydrolase activator NlpD
MDKQQDKKIRNYRLSLVDATSHERLWSLRFTRSTFLVAAISAVVIVVVGLFCLIAYTPIRTFIPGYPDAHSRRQAVQNSLRIDSLETRILQWELYTENLRRVIAGEAPIRMDSLILSNQAPRATVDSIYLAYKDSLLRADVAQREQFNLTGTQRNLPIEALSLYTPIKGVVSRGFEQSVHPWIDVTAPAGTPVMAVLDGTVVYTGWEDETGYTLAIQHKGDIISIYKNNQKVLRKSGDVVKGGTPVGMVASSSSLTTGDHLHFELWYEGTPVDPGQYISF